MAQFDKFKKSFEALKLFSAHCPKLTTIEKTLIPVKYLRHENVINKKECLKHCEDLGNVLISSNFRNHPDFNKLLSQSIELLFYLCNNDDADIRNVVNETFDKLIWNLIESNSNRLLSEFCKGITKSLSSRALRLSLIKFSEICHRIRPNKYRAFAINLYISFAGIIIESSKDELLQEALYLSICKIYPLLTPYAMKKEILDIINAYLSNLSTPSNTIRRFSALSIVYLCDSTREPVHYFNVVLSCLSSLISSSKGTPENKDILLSGIFMVAKCSFLKISKYLDKNDCNSKVVDSLLKNLSYIYHQMILTIKYTTSNILIISTLEALIEFFNAMPAKIFSLFNDLCGDDLEFKSLDSPNYLFKILTPNTKDTENYLFHNIENLNDEFEDEETFQKSSIFFNNAPSLDIEENVLEVSENMFDRNSVDNSEAYFDQGSEIDNRSIENDKILDFDITSETSSLNTSHKCLHSPFDSSFDLINENQLYSIDFDEFNLGNKFSFEHISKLICIKYLLKGYPGQLMTDSEVRVSVKVLSLSCLSSIIPHVPQILFEKIIHKKNISQLISDVFLYLNHSDPNIRGHLALIIGKYLKKTLSYSFSYEEFLMQNNLVNMENVCLDYFISTLVNLLFDSSSITVKYVLLSLQYFFPDLIVHNEVNIVLAFNLIYQLISLKSSPYWLIKIELITLFSKFSFKHLKHLEYIFKSSFYSADDQQQQQPLIISNQFLKNVPISKLILEEILFYFLFDSDHRVRQATLNLIPNFIENICLNNYVFQNDSLNLLVLDSMLSNYSLDIATKLFNGKYPSINLFEHYLNEGFQLFNSSNTDEYTNLRNLLIESNIAYFVKKLLYELRHKYYSKLSLTTALNSLSALSKLYPPSDYLNGWMIDSTDSLKSLHYSVEMIYFLIELLTKNQIIIYDLTLHQNLIELIMNLIEAVCLSCFKALESHQNEFEIESSNDVYKLLSPNFANCIETYFLYLYKIIVIYSSINEDNAIIFTSFIHNLYTKNTLISTKIKRHSASFFNTKEKDTWDKKAPSFSKGPKRREASAYDSMSFKLFDILKNQRHHYRKASSCSGRINDKNLHLNSILNTFSKLLEFTSASFLCNHLEDILIYLKMIFYLDPCAITCITNKLLKCIFEINYISMLVETYNRENIRISDHYSKSKSIDFKSFHNICFVIPYMKFNDIFDSKNREKKTNGLKWTSYLSWMRKWIEYKHTKIMNSDVTSSTDNKSNSISLKKFLTTKIQCFEPLVIQSMKHYTMTSETKFQSSILDLLVQLIQFHINYSLLDSENIFFSFIMKQFEYLETIYDSQPFELLMKHVFYFLSILSREHYISSELISTPKIIQLCDNLIANGHQKLAIDGLYILIDHLFYSAFDNTTILDVEYQSALETQQEVILAYCFKLINFNKTYHLLTLILNHYKNYDLTKWNDLSQQIIEIIINKLSHNIIKIESIEYYKSLQALIFSLSPIVFSQISSVSLELMFEEFESYHNANILFKYWLPKILIYLKLILLNLNESDLLSNTDRIKNKINIVNLNPNKNCSVDCSEIIDSEDIFTYFLLNLLQKTVMEIDNDLLNGNSSNNNKDHEMVVFYLRYYHLILAFVFQSGFYPKLTKSAIFFAKQPKADISLNNEIFDLRTVNDIFLKICKFYPVISISWLNFLYILNFEKLPKILSRCIEKKNLIVSIENNGNYVWSINLEILKRSSLILLCDYLSENLENVEFLSWFIINHLKEIIEHCHETPIKEFINAIHRKPVSSGLLLQVISLNSDELLSSPIMANKILYCLERSHNRQNIALIMFLLEKYLTNPKLTIYYKCCKYAESIITSRLILIYDTNRKTKSPPLFNYKDFNNLLKILKHTSYNKLYFTLKMIRIRFYDMNNNKRKPSNTIKDPLSKEKIFIPEFDKNWFIKIIECQMSQKQKNDSRALNSLDKLSNDDIINLIFSERFSMKNFVLILKMIAEKSCENDNKSKNMSMFNRKELAKSILPIYFHFLQSIVEKFPFIHCFDEKKIISKDDIFQLVTRHGFFIDLLLTFLPSFSFFLKNLTLFENYLLCEDVLFSSIILHLITIYSILIYPFQNEQNYQNLINITKMIECSLNNRNIFVQLCHEKNIHLQLILVNAIHFTFKYNFPLEEVNLQTPFQSDNDLKISTTDHEKLISIFHSLEKEDTLTELKEREIPSYSILLKKIVLSLSRFPSFNSLIYIPFNLLTSKNEHIWNGITSITKIPIIASQFLCEIDTFKQFMFRVANLSFVDRRQFEEIWMTLLGVFSESFSLITQNKHGEELNENIILSKLMIMTITNMLCNANIVSTDQHSDKEYGSSFGPKFELIQEIIERKSESFDNVSKFYNEPILNRSFIYKLKSIKECKIDENNPVKSLEHGNINKNIQTSIDIYSCIQFLIDFYLQQIRLCLNKQIYFPVVSEIAKSSLIISELFVEKNQYKKALELFIDLQKIVENFEDEILNQFVSTGFCKFYSILSTTDDIIDKHKKIIIERNFKKFFLPTRIYAIQSVEYLVESQLIKGRDLQPLLDYIIKHLNIEHAIPSSYCKEYVVKMVNISFVLIDYYLDIINSSDHYGEKILKGLMKLISRDINISILKTLNYSFEQLIRNKKISLEEANLLREIVLKKINKTTNQSYTIYMLNLIVCTSYFVGSTNFDFEIQDDNDKLFKTMEKLSIIFEPLRWCNSLEANVICDVLGYFLSEFFPTQDILNKCIGEFLSKQQNHYKYLINILYIIYSKLQIDCQQNDTAQDWVILSLSSFTQFVPISHALWALTCFLICASQNYWIRSSYFYFRNRFGKFSEQDKQAFFSICNNFYNEIKSDDNKMSFIKTFQKAACLPNSPYIEVLQYLCDDNL